MKISRPKLLPMLCFLMAFAIIFDYYIKNYKQSNDVVKYSNKGEPLVYDSNHDFTKSIGEIVKRITGQERVLAAPQKESLFERVFKKR